MSAKSKEDVYIVRRRRNSAMFAFILIFLGVIFLLNNYGFAYIDIGKLWPIFMIIVGLGILYEHNKNS